MVIDERARKDTRTIVISAGSNNDHITRNDWTPSDSDKSEHTGWYKDSDPGALLSALSISEPRLKLCSTIKCQSYTSIKGRNFNRRFPELYILVPFRYLLLAIFQW